MAKHAAKKALIHPVILSGGSGSRLWPLSRALYPKQFLPLFSDKSMFLDTALRVKGASFGAPMIICNMEHRFIVAEQARSEDVAPQVIVLEPVGRNTAPAAAVAALLLIDEDPGAVMMILPSDHVIRDTDALHTAVEAALLCAEDDALVTFGIKPIGPETGYGYICRGECWDSSPGCYHIDKFVEKPDLKTAQRYVDDDTYAWNSGIFLFKAKRFIEELEKKHPDTIAACRRAIDDGHQDLDFFRLDETAFKNCKSISIDYAVMEHTKSAAVIHVDMGWSDVGSWSALWRISDKDEHGNVLIGNVMANAVADSYVRTNDMLVTLLGIKNTIVVVTPDAVLIADKERSEEVRTVVKNLKNTNRTEHQ
jgi:mannose-1-phosphate guanylyltransferase/mannose-6-phosphate isomerase